METQILSSVLSAIAVTVLLAIGRYIRLLSKNFDRFMGEHLWLLASTMWNRDKVLRIMNELGMGLDDPPPEPLSERKKSKK